MTEQKLSQKDLEDILVEIERERWRVFVFEELKNIDSDFASKTAQGGSYLNYLPLIEEELNLIRNGYNPFELSSKVSEPLSIHPMHLFNDLLSKIEYRGEDNITEFFDSINNFNNHQKLLEYIKTTGDSCFDIQDSLKYVIEQIDKCLKNEERELSLEYLDTLGVVNNQMIWGINYMTSINEIVSVRGLLRKDPMKVRDVYRKYYLENRELYLPTIFPIIDHTWIISNYTELDPISVKDEEYDILISYLQSDYVLTKNRKPRSKKRIANELKTLVRNPNKDYSKMSQILQVGKTKNLKEIIECESLKLPGQYLPISQIGEGATSKIYRVRHPNDEDLAVKVFKNGFQLKGHLAYILYSNYQKLGKDLAVSEGQISRKISGHKNVIQFQGFLDDVTFEGDKVDALIYEFVDGENLEKRLNRVGPFNKEQIYHVFLQVLDGVNHVHKTHIHKDIKPDNILIENDSGIIKLLDSGMGVTIGTESGRFGAKLYRAPETYMKPHIDDIKVDIWSLGATLYQLSTGETIFTQKEKPNLEILLQQDDTFDLIQERIDTNAPKYLNSIIQKALQRNPKDRYQSATEMKEDLIQAYLPLESQERIKLLKQQQLNLQEQIDAETKKYIQ